jgi:hypothetical protein
MNGRPTSWLEREPGLRNARDAEQVRREEMRPVLEAHADRIAGELAEVLGLDPSLIVAFDTSDAR